MSIGWRSLGLAMIGFVGGFLAVFLLPEDLPSASTSHPDTQVVRKWADEPPVRIVGPPLVLNIDPSRRHEKDAL